MQANSTGSYGVYMAHQHTSYWTQMVQPLYSCCSHWIGRVCSWENHLSAAVTNTEADNNGSLLAHNIPTDKPSLSFKDSLGNTSLCTSQKWNEMEKSYIR